MERKHIGVIGVILLIALSGCATVSVNAEVGDANTVDRYELNITTSTTVYTILESSAQEDGYENLEEAFTDDEFDATAAESFEYNEEIDGNDATISLLISGLNVSQSDTISIEEEDGELVYRDDIFLDEEFDPAETQTTEGLVIEYELEMPGEITDSNADEVDGNTATWSRSGEDAYRGFVAEAQSPPPTDNPVPGFGVSAAAIALASAALIGAKREF